MLASATQILSYGISCTIGTILIFDFMDKMYHPSGLIQKYSFWVRAGFAALWIIINLFRVPILNFGFIITFSCLAGYLFYQRRHVRDYLQIILLIIIYAGCDALVSSVISVITHERMSIYGNNSVIFLLGVVLVPTIMFVLSRFLILLFKKQQINLLFKKQLIFLSVFPLLNVLVIYAITVLSAYEIDPSLDNFVMLIMAVLSIILNFAVILFFENLSKSTRLENDLFLVQQQLKMQFQYYQNLELEYNRSQKLMHDVKSHIGVIESLYQENSASEAHKYTEKLLEIVDGLALKFESDNHILNIIVNQKIKECSLHRITFTYSVENVDLSFMEGIDITSIFANLLDNAIEACDRVSGDGKKIELRIYQFHNMAIINVINTIECQPVRVNGHFISVKKNHKAVGIANVRRSVAKYDGDMDIEVEQDKFSVSIFLPLDQ